MLLTWLGAQPADEPYIIVRLVRGLTIAILEDLDQLVCDVYA